ncbi:MAG: hypothetical protein ACR2RL_15475 [Gammaproteobacteria bacterium]
MSRSIAKQQTTALPATALAATALPVVGALVLSAILGGPALAQGNAAHALWEDRCAQCHGPAGDLARKHLSVVEGELVGSKPEQNLREFLQNHHAAGADSSPSVYEMLLTQAGIEARFQSECTACHATAVDLVRRHLVMRDGIMYGRTSRQPLARFLIGHRNLVAEKDVPYFLELLRVVETQVDAQ